MAKVKVAITGTLSMPRSEVIKLIEQHTNAQFSPSVSSDTGYLVAARFDTEKARRAAKLGTTVINEGEMLGFVTQGAFPIIPLADRKRPCNFPHINWTNMLDHDTAYFLRYSDHDGILSERFLFFAWEGIGDDGTRYVGGFDVERFKTFRVDRIEVFEPV
jgi:hypothetical protein